MSGEESEAARNDLWLTYQEYDPAVKQAVRRLGALPGNNVEEFRNLFLASRERKRVKEFEADVIRRLQGEAFVDDEVLQQTLIVLHAENPGLAEQFKQFVTANGRPDDIDLTVARLRTGTDNPVMPERMPRKPRETPVSPVILPEPVVETPAPETPVAAKAPAPPPSAPVVPAKPVEQPHAERVTPPPIAALRPAAANDAGEAPRGSWTRRIGIIAAVLLIGAAGLLVLMPKSTTTEQTAAFKATTAPLRQASPEEPAPVAEPAPPAQTAPAQVAPAPPAQEGESLQAAPATEQARGDMQPPAQEPAAASQQAPAGVLARSPMPGTRYKVVKGDMLSAIAEQAYGDPSFYPMIQRANPGVRNANRIFYDQVIILPPKP